MQQLVSNTEQHVRSELASRDDSHDFSHIDRVRKVALHLGKLEGLADDSLRVVEVAALLHDIRDWKYAKGQAEPQCCEYSTSRCRAASSPQAGVGMA